MTVLIKLYQRRLNDLAAIAQTFASYNRLDVEANPDVIADSMMKQLMKVYTASKEEEDMIFERIGVSFEIKLMPTWTKEGKEIKKRLDWVLGDSSEQTKTEEEM